MSKRSKLASLRCVARIYSWPAAFLKLCQWLFFSSFLGRNRLPHRKKGTDISIKFILSVNECNKLISPTLMVKIMRTNTKCRVKLQSFYIRFNIKMRKHMYLCFDCGTASPGLFSKVNVKQTCFVSALTQSSKASCTT